jgi:hypothetical protein
LLLNKDSRLEKKRGQSVQPLERRGRATTVELLEGSKRWDWGPRRQRLEHTLPICGITGGGAIVIKTYVGYETSFQL